MKRSIAAVLLVVALGAAVALPAAAQDMIGTEITSITTVSLAGEATTVADAPGNSSFEGSSFTITFLGLTEMITAIEAGGMTIPVESAIPATVVPRRNPADDTRQVGWYQGSVNPNDNTITIAATGPHTAEELLNTNSVIRGLDNVFQNEGATVGDTAFQGNQAIERIDFLLEAPVMAGDDIAFAVFEKGPAGANHDAFGIAAITAVDDAGNPAAFGPLYQIPAGWGQPILAQYPPYMVLSNGDDGSGGTPTSLTLQASAQTMGGILFRTSELVEAGTEVYGYALVGPDVTCSPEELIDVLAACYPATTGNEGGLDLVSANLGALMLGG
ncbi:MAG: hypothetical protein GYB65_11575 [Chloroflexi bacterium]|nr:hypothetical protein [Chloroflexota bacterium]